MSTFLINYETLFSSVSQTIYSFTKTVRKIGKLAVENESILCHVNVVFDK
jgi:hypothetical protein